MLKERIVTAIVLIGLFLAILYYLPASFFPVVIALMALGGAWEWSQLSGITSHIGRGLYTAAAALMMVFTYLYVIQGGQEVLLQFLGSAILWWVVALAWVVTYPKSTSLWGNVWTKSLMGWFILVPMWAAIVILRMSEHGSNAVLFVVFVVILADTGAYVAGVNFGKNKLAPAVSPGKSWEGLAGGIVANLILALVFTFTNSLSLADGIMLSVAILVTTLFSVLGDLTESMVKRQSNMKDSGTILPGHGGIMDRLDGMSAALPVFAFIYLFSH